MLRIAPALPRDASMPRGHDLDAIATTITPQTRLVYLANPNNPTGTWFAHDAFAAFLARVPVDTLVVIDEAYAEIADAPDFASALSLLAAHRNLVVTQSSLTHPFDWHIQLISTINAVTDDYHAP